MVPTWLSVLGMGWGLLILIGVAAVLEPPAPLGLEPMSWAETGLLFLLLCFWPLIAAIVVIMAHLEPWLPKRR